VTSSSGHSAESSWQHRRRLSEVFGDLPDTTSDERDPEDRTDDTRRSDTWLEEQVPPHHGG